MPSSHMVVTGIFATLMTISNRKDIFLALGLSALEAIARYKLRYHYPSQILAGYVFGIIYTLIAIKYNTE
jgi:membrane-associated phospholipid phosphatase